MPPQANATVLAVHGAGVKDDWDRPSVAGGAKWAGEVRAYYREATDRQRTAEGPVVAVKRELLIDTADLATLGLDTDDRLTFRVDTAAANATGTAKVIRRSELAGIPGTLQTSKITLEDG